MCFCVLGEEGVDGDMVGKVVIALAGTPTV